MLGVGRTWAYSSAVSLTRTVGFCLLKPFRRPQRPMPYNLPLLHKEWEEFSGLFRFQADLQEHERIPRAFRRRNDKVKLSSDPGNYTIFNLSLSLRLLFAIKCRTMCVRAHEFGEKSLRHTFPPEGLDFSPRIDGFRASKGGFRHLTRRVLNEECLRKDFAVERGFRSENGHPRLWPLSKRRERRAFG